MRLDVVGIDLLSTDLSQPWHSNGTAICEVNAQPQLGYSDPDFYWRFLKRYLKPAIPTKITISTNTVATRPVLFDPQDSTLNLSLQVRDVLQQGCPIQYFDELQIAEDVSADDHRKLTQMLKSVSPAAI